MPQAGSQVFLWEFTEQTEPRSKALVRAKPDLGESCTADHTSTNASLGKACIFKGFPEQSKSLLKRTPWCQSCKKAGVLTGQTLQV